MANAVLLVKVKISNVCDDDIKEFENTVRWVIREEGGLFSLIDEEYEIIKIERE